MKRRYKVLLGIIAFLGILTIYAFHISEMPPMPEKPNNSIRVMSYNLKYGSSDLDTLDVRKEALVNQILSYMPDSIGIQEGDYYWMTESGGLPELLEGYEYVGVGRTDGEMDGEYAAIFYLKDKYNVIDSGTFWLSETPDVPSKGWDAADYRICTWVTLENKETKEQYTHYNTHLDHIGEEAQMEGAKLIVETIEESDLPYVLTGDFNVLEGSDVYDEIVNSYVINDSKYLANDTMSHGTMNWFLPLNFKLVPPIDFVFVSNDMIVHTYRVDTDVWVNDLPVSDHYPVIVDIEISELMIG